MPESVMDQVLLAVAKFYLFLPSLLMNAVYAMGPVVAPLLGLALCCAFPFIALRDKKEG
jgi:hypothetical protein